MMDPINKSLELLSYNTLQIHKLVKTSALEIMCISLEKGAEFPEHTSPADAHLIVLEGGIDFHIDGKIHQLYKHHYYAFPKAQPHWVSARENSKFLIIR